MNDEIRADLHYIAEELVAMANTVGTLKQNLQEVLMSAKYEYVVLSDEEKDSLEGCELEGDIGNLADILQALDETELEDWAATLDEM